MTLAALQGMRPMMSSRLEQFALLAVPALVDGLITIVKGGAVEEALIIAAERLQSARARLKFPDLQEE